MRRAIGVAVCAALAVTLPACGKRDRGIKEVREAVGNTAHLPQRYVYTVNTPEGTTEVKGLVEDDFRFKARVSFNGTDGYDQVVSDDVLATRFIDPTRIQGFVDKKRTADVSTDVEGVTVLDALRSRRWVVDRKGAPAVTGGGADTDPGEDPVLESLSVLSYVELAAREADEVKRFEPEALSPVYSSSEDTFPKPEKGSGVDRYDFRRPTLPNVSSGGDQGAAGGQAGFPQARHFRRMAVYVKDGRIIQVREAIDLRGKKLDDFVKYLRAFFKEAKLPKQARDAFEKTVRDTPNRELSTELLSLLNIGLVQAGFDAIPIRQMTLDLRDVGGDVKVDLPTGQVINGSLTALTLSKQGKSEPSASDTAATGGASPDGDVPPADAGDTTATTAAP